MQARDIRFHDVAFKSAKSSDQTGDFRTFFVLPPPHPYLVSSSLLGPQLSGSVYVADSTRILPQRPCSSIRLHSTYCLLPSLPKTQTNIVQMDSYLLLTLP